MRHLLLTRSHVHAVVQHGPQHLLAEAVVMALQHLLVDEHRETVQLPQRLLHLPALLHRHVDAQRDAAHIPRLATRQKRRMPPLVEGGVVGLPGDAGEQAQLVELRRPVAVRVAREVDGKELRDEQQRLLAVLVRGVISQTLFITPYAYDNALTRSRLARRIEGGGGEGAKRHAGNLLDLLFVERVNNVHAL